MRALTTSEFCALYNISPGYLKKLHRMGFVFCLGLPSGKMARWRDPGAEFMQRILDREIFCDNARWLKSTDLSAYFGVTYRVVRLWVRRGKLKGMTVDGIDYFSVQDVRTFRKRYDRIKDDNGAGMLTMRMGPAPPRNLSFKEQALQGSPVHNPAPDPLD